MTDPTNALSDREYNSHFITFYIILILVNDFVNEQPIIIFSI